MKIFLIAMVVIVFLGFGSLSLGADFSGDGKDNLAIFRPASGLWAVRGVTRVYFGTGGDTPVPGDYAGDGRAEIAIFRPGSGLWAVRETTRVYYGTGGDTPLSGGGGGGFWNAEGNKLYYDGGYVGIGVDDPDAPLQVDYSIKVGSSTTSSPFIYLDNSAGGVNAMGLYSASREMYVGTGNTKLSLRTSGWPRLTIDSSGNVGIGTQTPSRKLAVKGLTGTSSYNDLKVNTSTGDFYYSTSSERCKKDVEKLEKDFHQVLKVEPKKYVDNASGQKEIGYIAEEFDELGLDDLVIYDGAGRPNGLKYDRITLYLVELVKEQQQRIETLEAALEDSQGGTRLTAAVE